ncbi:MAG: efflux RND transporter periplasmic adaptor subunit [Deltaproteobacteria bacterium]
MRRRLAIPAVVLLFVLVAGVAYFRLRPPAKVDVFVAKTGKIEEIVTSVSAGTVKSRWEATLSAESPGRVLRVSVDEGDRVRQGDLLVTLVDPELDRQVAAAGAEVMLAEELLRQAEARREEVRTRAASDRTRADTNLAKAREEHRRAAGLFAGGFLSKAEMDRADAALSNAEEDARLASTGEFAIRAVDREIDSLRARVAAARARRDASAERLRKMRIVSPFAGIVVRRMVEPGETKQPGSPLLELADPDSLYIEAPIDESESAKVRAGQPVRFYPDAYLGETFRGVVSEVQPVIETSREVSRANTIRVTILDAPRPLRLGMSVDVEVLTGSKENALQVPTSAIMEREGEKFVYRVRGGKVERSDVVTGISNWDRTEILSGLFPGDPVVTSLEIKDLAPGSRVGIRSRR